MRFETRRNVRETRKVVRHHHQHHNFDHADLPTKAEPRRRGLFQRLPKANDGDDGDDDSSPLSSSSPELQERGGECLLPRTRALKKAQAGAQGPRRRPC